MSDRTMTAMFDTRGAAEAAVEELVSAGIPRDGISIRGAETGGTTTTTSTTGEDRGFWGSLSDLFMPDEDRSAYEEGLRRGGYLLSVRPPQGLEDEAVAILERAEPMDVDSQSASWRESGWTGASAGATTAGAAAAGTPYLAGETRTEVETTRSAPTLAETGGATATGATGAARSVEGEETLKVMEEQLRVGKREVGRGSVRVRSYVREIPIEEQVELRQEHVTIERRPVDRELSAGEATAAFQERTIEAVERGEEAVVSKSARVVEEIGIRKDVERETETVRDTVRKQEVEVDDDRSTAAGRVAGTATTTVEDTTATGTGRATLDPNLDPSTR